MKKNNKTRPYEIPDLIKKDQAQIAENALFKAKALEHKLMNQCILTTVKLPDGTIVCSTIDNIDRIICNLNNNK